MPFKKKIAAVRRVNDNVNDFILGIIAQPSVTNFVLDANRDQLNVGVDANSNPITPPYTPTTVGIKISKGQEFRWVTLRDTGDFHRSFRLIFHADSFELVATDRKRRSLKEKYGAAITGLTAQSIGDVSMFILPLARQGLDRELSK